MDNVDELLDFVCVRCSTDEMLDHTIESMAGSRVKERMRVGSGLDWSLLIALRELQIWYRESLALIFSRVHFPGLCRDSTLTYAMKWKEVEWYE